LAIAFLRVRYADDEVQWGLLVDKATRWVNKQLPAGQSSADLIATAGQLFA